MRVQLPIALDDASEPEPDVAVVPGAPRDYLREHPSVPVIVVEVAQDSLRADRILRARLYARADIADYWTVNLVDRVPEVHRAPTRASPRRPRAHTDVRRLLPWESITPLAAPSARIDVAALLP